MMGDISIGALHNRLSLASEGRDLYDPQVVESAEKALQLFLLFSFIFGSAR